jgi:hypothetical protein
MAFPAYRVILNPNDKHVIHVGRVKMLTTEEANVIREMVKNEVGKTVSRFGGLSGEEYEIMSTFPNIHDIHTFVRGLESDSVSFDTYYTAKYSEKATTANPTTKTYQCSPAMATCDGLPPINHIL